MPCTVDCPEELTRLKSCSQPKAIQQTNSRWTSEYIRTQIATSLLEIKAQYQDVTFAEIQLFQTRGKDLPDDSTDKPDLQLRYKVGVGPLRPRASALTSTPSQPSPAALAAEKAILPAYLSPQSLDYFLHVMPDTGEGGAPGWVLAFHQGGTDDEFEALVAQHLPEDRHNPAEMARLRALFHEFQEELSSSLAAAATADNNDDDNNDTTTTTTT
jgi:hypothetical protein